MIFNSLDFMLFFPIVTLAYFIIPSKLKHMWLLVASYYFYMCWNAKYAILIFTSTVITYLSGIAMEYIKSKSWKEEQIVLCKKLVVGVSFGSNLAILFYYKYANFAVETVQKLLAMIDVQINVPVFDVILPVGISFYTFQALSYTMDVYRGDIYAEKNFFRYALFVSFFPQLVAGPIERSKNLLKQLATPKKFNYELAREGVFLMIWGFFLKIVLADRVAIFVDTIYGDVSMYGGWYLIVATILFAVQIYCDFSGYSIIAMGASKILGIELMENFNAPYFSKSVGEFWRRWHISLSSWFKDYLYFPLGGSRKGKLRKHINKMIVFLVSGLWHGANFSFVIWGVLNGLYQVIGEITLSIREKVLTILKINRESLGHKLVQMLTTFILVDFSWIFFRADGLESSLQVVNSIINVHNPWVLFDGSLYRCGLDQKEFHLMLICIVILIFADYMKYKKIKIREVLIAQDGWLRWGIVVISVILVAIFGVWGPMHDSSSFIYFQF